MALNIGVQALSQSTGRPVTALVSSQDAEWLPIGALIAWPLIAAQTPAGSLADDMPYADGEKVVEFGTVFVQIDGGTYDKQWAPIALAVHAAPTVAPVGTIGAGGALPDGVHLIEYTYVMTAGGETLPSAQDSTTSSSTNNTINTASLTPLPAGVASVNWYMSTVPGGTIMAFKKNGTGGAEAFTTLPEPGAALAPTVSTALTATHKQGELRRGHVAILNQSIRQLDAIYGLQESTAVGLFTGGLTWTERLKVDGSGLPDLADLLAVLPELTLTPAE